MPTENIGDFPTRATKMMWLQMLSVRPVIAVCYATARVVAVENCIYVNMSVLRC